MKKKSLTILALSLLSGYSFADGCSVVTGAAETFPVCAFYPTLLN